jgi:hypothetical protein
MVVQGLGRVESTSFVIVCANHYVKQNCAADGHLRWVGGGWGQAGGNRGKKCRAAWQHSQSMAVAVSVLSALITLQAS